MSMAGGIFRGGACVVAAGWLLVGVAEARDDASRRPRVTVIEYDSFEAPGGYTMSDYFAKWSNPYGPGEMGVEETRAFDNDRFSIEAVPFRTGADFSVYDHIKYLAISNEAFEVPADGAITFSMVIEAETPGTIPNHVIEGTYGPPGSYPEGEPYAATVLQGQQAGVTLHMIDFYTGQLFDWFVAGDTAFTLIERLPSSVTGSPLYAGRNEMYTQIIDEVEIEPGPHTVSIRYERGEHSDRVEYRLDGKLVSTVRNIGVPLDRQRVPYTGIYPSLGPGEPLRDRIGHVVIGHGLFSLLDAFPFQHPEAPELSVSIPLEHRLFGQGARARFDDVRVIIEHRGRP